MIKHHEQRQPGEGKVNLIKGSLVSPSLGKVGARICAGLELKQSRWRSAAYCLALGDLLSLLCYIICDPDLRGGTPYKELRPPSPLI